MGQKYSTTKYEPVQEFDLKKLKEEAVIPVYEETTVNAYRRGFSGWSLDMNFTPKELFLSVVPMDVALYINRSVNKNSELYCFIDDEYTGYNADLLRPRDMYSGYILGNPNLVKFWGFKILVVPRPEEVFKREILELRRRIEELENHDVH